MSVIFASPVAVKDVASAAVKPAIVDAEPVPARVMLVKPSSAAASLSVIAPAVKPLTLMVSALAVGVAVRAPRPIPSVPVPELPDSVTVVSALRSIVEFP